MQSTLNQLLTFIPLVHSGLATALLMVTAKRTAMPMSCTRNTRSPPVKTRRRCLLNWLNIKKTRRPMASITAVFTSISLAPNAAFILFVTSMTLINWTLF